jgi:hypothetical protein
MERVTAAVQYLGYWLVDNPKKGAWVILGILVVGGLF